MKNVTIMPQPWPAATYTDGIIAICKQFAKVSEATTNRGHMIIVGNTQQEYQNDYKLGLQYCRQNQIDIISWQTLKNAIKL